MTFLPVIRTIRGIEIGLAGYRKSKAHLTVSRIASLHGIAGKTHQALSDALSPTICPRCTTSFFFFFLWWPSDAHSRFRRAVNSAKVWQKGAELGGQTTGTEGIRAFAGTL